MNEPIRRRAAHDVAQAVCPRERLAELGSRIVFALGFAESSGQSPTGARRTFRLVARDNGHRLALTA
jgi:hypothetical protein